MFPIKIIYKSGNSMYRKITRAFTIVELIICVAVLAILASIALPYFHEYQSRQEAKQIPIKLSAVNRSEERRVGKECRARGTGSFQAEDGIRDFHVTGVQTCALPI